MLVSIAGGALIVMWAASAIAIDNPDAPDDVAQFQARAKPFEDRLDNESGGVGASTASGAYARFLDAELNKAYNGLLPRLDAGARQALVDSERQWLRYREAETRFIDRQWTTEHFGSSAALSRGLYRTDMVKQRVLQLLAYLGEAPTTRR